MRGGLGTGAGSGEPLAFRNGERGGVGTGAGSGEPLRATMEADTGRLLGDWLTELITGSTIKSARSRKARRIDTVFIVVEPSRVQP
jgi:hypothetical protein